MVMWWSDIDDNLALPVMHRGPLSSLIWGHVSLGALVGFLLSDKVLKQYHIELIEKKKQSKHCLLLLLFGCESVH